MIYGTRITTFCIAILLSLSFTVSAGQVPDLNIFKNGTAADADKVNTNFDEIKKVVNDNDERITALSQPRSASVTCSAMGFVPVSANLLFVKDIEDGSLSVNTLSGGQFYHSVTLPSGVTITNIRAHVKDESNGAQVSVELKKKEKGEEPDSLVTLIANVSSGEDPEQVFEEKLGNPETIEWAATGALPSYYVEVLLNGRDVYLYSVTIDYEYTEP